LLLVALPANAQVLFEDTFEVLTPVWDDPNTELPARQTGGSAGSTYSYSADSANSLLIMNSGGIPSGSALVRIIASGDNSRATILDLDTNFGAELSNSVWSLSYEGHIGASVVYSGWAGFSVGNPAGSPDGVDAGFGMIVDAAGVFKILNNGMLAGVADMGYDLAGKHYAINATFNESAGTAKITYSDATTNFNVGTYSAAFADDSRFIELKNYVASASGAGFVDWRVDNLTIEIIDADLPPDPDEGITETFEVEDGVTSGMIDGQNGWVVVDGGSAEVQSGITHTGAQALRMQEARVTRDLAKDGSALWMRFHMRCEGAPAVNPILSDPDTSLAFFVDTNLNLVAYSGVVPVELGVQVPTNVWLRFDVYCDYDDSYWNLSMNGVNVAAGLPLYSANTQMDSVGFGNGESAPVYVDQINVADTEQTFGELPDTDNDGIPDWWEQKHFGGVASVVAGATSGNGNLTYLETYVAGVSPITFDPFMVWTVPGGNGLAWTPAQGRWYSVYWANSLTNEFSRLPGYFKYPQSEFIDSIHTDDDTGFYRLEVQVQ